MYKFSQVSEMRLATCHPDLIRLAHEAIRDSPWDFIITHGHRSIAVQYSLYQKGRECINGKWIVTERSKVVTSRDGIKVKSKHNFIPSHAFDIAILDEESKVTWDTKYYEDVAEHILKIAEELKDKGLIISIIRWGGSFSNYDGPHYEIFQ